MEVFALIYTRKDDRWLFTECWGVFSTEEKAKEALTEGYWELVNCVDIKDKIITDDRVIIYSDDDVMYKLNVDVTTYYEEEI